MTNTHRFGHAHRTRVARWLAGLVTCGIALAATPALAQPPGWLYGPAKHAEPSDPPVATWDPTRVAVALEGRTTWLRDDAAKRLTGDRSTTSAGLSLQADAYRLTDKIALRVDASWLTDSSTTFQQSTTMTETLKTDLVGFGVGVRYHIFRWLAPYGRVAGGIGWDRLTVHTSQADLHDRQAFGQVSAGGGLFVRTQCLRLRESMPWPRVGLVGHIEGGYIAAGGSDFTLQSSPGSSAQTPIPTSPVAVGHVSRSAPYVRFSVGLGF
jgi:hypothetical protein